MINRFITFSIFCVLSLSVTTALPQSDPYNGYSVQHLTDESGLPQNSINDLLFDKNGCLWLGSQVGLVRFNGSAFKLYYPDDKPVMESNVVSLGKNDRGDIYFQTSDHSLYCYSGNNSHFLSPVNTAVLKRPYLLNARKQFFDFTRFLNEGPAGENERRRLIFRDLFEHTGNFYAVDSAHLYLIYNDTLYYSDNRRLQKLDAQPNAPLQYLLLDRKLYVLHRDSVIAAYEEDRKIMGRQAIGGDLLHDASKLRQSGSRFRLYPCNKVNHLLAGRRLYRIAAGPDGSLRTTFLIDLDFITNVSAVEYNTSLDLLLIATHTEGFYFLRKSRFQVSGWPDWLRQRAAHHLFGPMALDTGQRILTDKFIFDPAGAYEPVRDSIPIWQRCLYIDKKEQAWAAIYNLPRRLNGHLHPVQVYPALDAAVVDYTGDENGHLYCLTARSLWQLEPDKGDSFHRLADIGAPGTPNNPARGANESFCLVGPGRLWIANVNGLIEYDLRSHVSRAIPELAGSHVRAIHLCKDGSVLLGTYGQGYFYFYHGKFYRMPLDRNGFLITAHCFLEDPHGTIWIPCNKGLFKVPKADMDAWCDGNINELYYYYYGRQDGLLTNEFNGGFNASGVITPKGFVALLSMKGMVCFYTDSLASDFPQGPIEMTHLEIDGKPAGRTDTITLAAGYSSLVPEITCPYLGNRNNLYLQYNLQGLNDEWKEVPDDGMVNLSRLEPGRYMFRVRKVNGFGRNNYQYKEWRIVVTPNFYRTSWFILLVVLALLALLVWSAQLRWKLVEKKKEIGVKAAKLRGAVVTLEETVKKLQESEKALLRTSQQREKLISLVIHDLRSPLRFLTMLTADLHDNQGRLTAEEMKERSYMVKKGAQDIYHFSEDFLLWVTSQKDNFSVANRVFLIRPLLQEINDFFCEQVQQKGNTLSYSADEKLQIDSDPHILITIIRNLTDNANKYTSGGTITIEACREGEMVLISVTDTGRGMSRQQIERFLLNDSLEDVKSGSQLGHKFIFDLTQRINGVISIESREGEGTTVTIRLPVKNI
ncbi:MAG TPA: ATP-binding protein [Puia sp.]|jgi:signal transduction histidine kinase